MSIDRFRLPISDRSPHPDLILDSGAYSLWMSGLPVDFDRYAKYAAGVQGMLLAPVNLDVIPGRRGQRPTRNEIDAASFASFVRFKALREVCPSTMAVYHQGDRLIWLHRYLEMGARFIGISPSDAYPPYARHQWLIEVHRHMRLIGVPLCREVFTHALGLFALDTLKALQGMAWSADATTINRWSVSRRVLVPLWHNEVSFSGPIDTVVPKYVGQKAVPQVEAYIDSDDLKEYIQAAGQGESVQRRGAWIEIDSVPAIASVNLALVRRLNHLTGLRLFIAGSDERVNSQVNAVEQYPYVLQTFASAPKSDTEGQMVRDAYNRVSRTTGGKAIPLLAVTE